MRAHPTDNVPRGSRWRLTYSRGSSIQQGLNFLNPFSSGSFVKIFNTLPEVTNGLVFPISPAPADADSVAVIDVKVSVTAPTISVGALADKLNTITDATYLKRMESIDATALGTSDAAVERQRIATEQRKTDQSNDPLGKIVGTVKTAALIVAVVVGIAVAVAIYRSGIIPTKRRK